MSPGAADHEEHNARGRWLRRSVAVSILLALTAGGILAMRWSIEGDHFPGVTTDCIIDFARFQNAKNAVGSSQVLVVHVDGDPETRQVYDYDAEDYPATVQRYLRGSGDGSITVTEPKNHGSDCSAAEHVRFEKGHIYVLFLAPIPSRRWAFPGLPYGFEVLDDGSLLALDQGYYTVEPSDWHIENVSDIEEAIQSVSAATPAEAGALP